MIVNRVSLPALMAMVLVGALAWSPASSQAETNFRG
jgi:hypothetical protein